MPYFPHLDALRFLAFLLVFFSHISQVCFVPLAAKGYFVFKVLRLIFLSGNLGVNLFFTLSGFLITYLLLHEQSQKNTINVGYFYMRRILRIWPVYFLVLIFGFYIGHHLNIEQSYVSNPDRFFYYAFFLGNYDLLYYSNQYNLLIAVLWSVSIEEQFYLIYPNLIKFIKNKYLPAVFVSIIILSQLYIVFIYPNEDYLSFHSIPATSDLAVGCLLGYFCYEGSKLNVPFLNTKLFSALLYVLLLSLVAIKFFVGYFYVQLLFSVCFAFIIFDQCYNKNTLFHYSKFKIFTELGKISYGLYSYHMICIMITISTIHHYLGEDKPLVALLCMILSGIFTLALAKISYKYMEIPTLKLKNKFT